jgi:hypothetical protein
MYTLEEIEKQREIQRSIWVEPKLYGIEEYDGIVSSCQTLINLLNQLEKCINLINTMLISKEKYLFIYGTKIDKRTIEDKYNTLHNKYDYLRKQQVELLKPLLDKSEDSDEEYEDESEDDSVNELSEMLQGLNPADIDIPEQTTKKLRM